MKFKMKTEGLDKHLRQLQRMGKAPRGVLKEAAQAGGQVIADAANQAAPGPHVIVEVTESAAGFVEVGIGPDKDHWFYRFFETGAQPHEVTAKTPKGLVFYDPEFGIIVMPRMQHPGIPASPFLRPAADAFADAAAQATAEVFWRRIAEEAESG